jgi:hypothetical protein
MARNTPSNVIDATALFAARRRDTEASKLESQEERRALEIAAKVHRMLEV